MWLSGNEPGYPWGYRFHPWPCSVGEGSSVAVSCDVGCRCGSDPVWPWWRRLAATAPIQTPAWEHAYALGATLESNNNNSKSVCSLSKGDKQVKKKKEKLAIIIMSYTEDNERKTY